MRLISTNVHGMFDYLFGALLIAIPWLFDYAAVGGPETWIPVFLGITVIGYSLFTNYEWGVVKRIPMRAHLILDILVGVTLLMSIPFFGFFDQTTWVPLIVAGVAAIASGALTRREPQSVRPRLSGPQQWTP